MHGTRGDSPIPETRSLSALFGTLLVPVAYLVGRELASPRAGLAAAALIAVNPLLVWYSQEARAYMLLALLGGVSFHYFARSLRDPRPRTLAAWALASALALGTRGRSVLLLQQGLSPPSLFGSSSSAPVAVAVGFVKPLTRLRLLGLAALAVLSAVVTVATLWEPKYHREDWREAAEALDPAPGPRAIVVTPVNGALPLELYLGLSTSPDATRFVRATEIDVIVGAQRPLGAVENPSTPRPPSPPAPSPEFVVVERVEADLFTLIRYESATAMALSTERLLGMAPGLDDAALVVQPGARPRAD